MEKPATYPNKLPRAVMSEISMYAVPQGAAIFLLLSSNFGVEIKLFLFPPAWGSFLGVETLLGGIYSSVYTYVHLQKK